MTEEAIEAAATAEADNRYPQSGVNNAPFTTTGELYDLVKEVFECGANWQANQQWIDVKDRLPEVTNKHNVADKWCLCRTEDKAVILSLCYYDHKKNLWYDGFYPQSETRITEWKKPI